MRVSETTKTTVRLNMTDVQKMVQAYLEDNGISVTGKCDVRIDYTCDDFDRPDITGIIVTCGEVTKESTV